MKYNAKLLSKSEKELLRRLAVQRVLDGESPKSVTESYGLGDKTIFKWLRAAKENGLDSLAAKPIPGRKCKLSPEQEQEVKRWVVNGDPRQYNFDYALWTRQIISDLIRSRFNIELSDTSVGTLLKKVGLTPQKPLRRAYERDEEAVEEWKKDIYPEIKKEAKKQGAEILWLDEASIRSDDPLMRTWGEKGKTPTVKTSGQRQGINAISAVSNKGAFWYRIFSGKFNTDVFIDCLKEIIKFRKKPVFIITDGHPVHKSKKLLRFLDSLEGKLKIFILPPYAPDLNPDELVWNYMRQIGTAREPLKENESLLLRTTIDMEILSQDKKLVKSFFQNESVSFAAA
jgi:transposase